MLLVEAIAYGIYFEVYAWMLGDIISLAKVIMFYY